MSGLPPYHTLDGSNIFIDMNYKVYKQTLQCLFEGRANAMQKALIEDFLADPNNKELYFLWLEEWERNNPQLLADADLAYQRLSEKSDKTGATRVAKSPVTRSLNFLWIAASVVILLTGGSFFFRDDILTRQYKTDYGELKTVILADGSTVTLNANSSIKVPRFNFGKGTREVFLAGEAAFSVKHLPAHNRFIVRTPDQLEVQVLGTEFMVYSRNRGSKVVLNEGSVQLRSLKKQMSKPVVIIPGDVVMVSSQGSFSISHQQRLSVHSDWKDRRFSFENTPVSEIAHQITEVFGAQIIISDSTLSKRTLGGTFKAKSAEELLDVIADMLEVRVVPNTASSEEIKTYTLTY
jgi:transmembrane sensor